MIYTYNDAKQIEGYIDGRYHENMMLLLRHIDPNGSSSYKNFIWYAGATNELSQINKCCCSHDIIHEHQAEHIITHDRIILGSRCIELFNPDYKKMTTSIWKEILKEGLMIKDINDITILREGKEHVFKVEKEFFFNRM